MAISALPGVSGTDRLPTDRASNVVSGTIGAVGPSKPFEVWGPMNVFLYGSRSTSLVTTAASLTATPASLTGIAAGDAISSTVVPPGTTVGALPGGGVVTLALAPQAWQGEPRSGSPSIAMNVDSAGNLPNGKSLSTLVGATILNSPYFASGATIVSVSADGKSLIASSQATSSPDTVKNPPTLIWFAPTANAIAAGTDAAAIFTGSGSGYQATALTAQLERSFDGGSTWVACNVGFGSLATFAQGSTPYSIAFGDPEAAMLYRINTLAYTALANVTMNYRVSTTGQAATSISLQTI